MGSGRLLDAATGMSGVGTFETFPPALRTSAYRGRPEVFCKRWKRRFWTHLRHHAASGTRRHRF